jgi:hypothetical protein
VFLLAPLSSFSLSPLFHLSSLSPPSP